MDEGVRLLFERALDGEPAVPAGEMAREAMAVGRRLRRRRGLAVGAAAGVVAVLAGAVAVAATPQPADDTTPPVPWRVSMMADPACTFPVAGDATDAVVFLRVDVTDRQRRELGATLRSDREVRGVRFESKQQVYARFKRIYADAPDLVGAVKVDQIPDSFLVTLTKPAAYARFRAQFSTAGGVDEIVGYRCPDGLPRGAGR